MAHTEDYGPLGDERCHLAMVDLEAGFAALPPAGKNRGTVRLVVARRSDGVRDLLDRARLTPEGGVPGDRWARLRSDRPEQQLAVMRSDVAALLAGGQPIEIAGDNLFVDLDLSATNLPFGTRLRVGQAVVEMTPEPHKGCKKFRGRFGLDALRYISAKERDAENLRGVYWRVIESGDVAPGDAIEVLSR